MTLFLFFATAAVIGGAPLTLLFGGDVAGLWAAVCFAAWLAVQD